MDGQRPGVLSARPSQDAVAADEAAEERVARMQASARRRERRWLVVGALAEVLFDAPGATLVAATWLSNFTFSDQQSSTWLDGRTASDIIWTSFVVAGLVVPFLVARATGSDRWFALLPLLALVTVSAAILAAIPLDRAVDPAGNDPITNPIFVVFVAVIGYAASSDW